MEPIIKELLTLYGPLSLGWVFFALLLVYRMKEQRAEREAREKITVMVTDALLKNAETDTRLATMLDERLPKGGA